MLKRLLGRQPIEVWVIKQIDDDLLHLCGRATVEAKPNRKATLIRLYAGQYEGPVRMATGGGLVLNAQLFARLVPLDDLQLLPDGQARWQGRDWPVAQVPQRCWAYRGRLTTQIAPVAGRPTLVSCEDVSHIRRRARQEPPAGADEPVRFYGLVGKEHPLLAPRDEDDPAKAGGQRPAPGHEWRRDDE